MSIGYESPLEETAEGRVPSAVERLIILDSATGTHMLATRLGPGIGFYLVTFVAALMIIPRCGLWPLAGWLLATMWLQGLAGSFHGPQSKQQRRQSHRYPRKCR